MKLSIHPRSGASVSEPGSQLVSGFKNTEPASETSPHIFILKNRNVSDVYKILMMYGPATNLATIFAFLSASCPSGELINLMQTRAKVEYILGLGRAPNLEQSNVRDKSTC